MCTVSWWRRDGQLSLRFNRDEQRGRPLAEVPCLREGELIWPKDPQGGGTWICVDRWGTVHCLLNHYDAEMSAPPPDPKSRGELPLLSATHAQGEISGWLEPLAYPPFHLFRIPLEGEITHVTWDGQRLEAGSVHLDLTLWTTSGWNVQEVVAARAELFECMIGDRGLSEETLEAFHFSIDPEHPGRWPRMSREDALTESYSEIRVTENEISFCYIPLEDHDRGSVTLCRQSRLPIER